MAMLAQTPPFRPVSHEQLARFSASDILSEWQVGPRRVDSGFLIHQVPGGLRGRESNIVGGAYLCVEDISVFAVPLTNAASHEFRIGQIEQVADQRPATGTWGSLFRRGF